MLLRVTKYVLFKLQRSAAHFTRAAWPAAQEEIFRRFWGLRNVLNRPRRSATYLAAELAQFVRQHKCRRWETLASVAVQYGSDVAALRRLNNLMSDDALRSRVRVYVPGDKTSVQLCLPAVT